MKYMAKFIGYQTEHENALYIRRVFKVEKSIERATLKLSALGIVKGFCNGKELDCDLLTPGWTNYHKRIPFYTFDVTGQLQMGENVLAATLGNGWAIGKIAWFGTKHYGNQPLMWCKLEIEYADGTKECVESDENFKVAFGQIQSNDIYDGEYQDARCDLGAFMLTDYDDTSWENATVHEGYLERLEPAIAPLTKKRERYSGTYLYDREGYQVYDFRQNHVGVPEVEIKHAKEGTKLTFIFGEMLNEDGSVYIGNLRSAKVTDVYICREGNQVFAPHMTFHGYRYMGVKIDGECELGRIVSAMIYSDISFHASFECSDETVNQLYRNIVAGQKSNFVNVPTDCPQRDERLGWTGDAQVFCHSAMVNADCRAFFRKFLVDIMDAQLENGMIDSVAPTVRVDFDQVCGSAAWGDVITILPYEYYCVYKDASIIKLTLDSAKQWVQFCVNDSEEYVRADKGYGDWLSMNETTDKWFLSMLYMAYSALLVSKMCDIVGDVEGEQYRALYADIKNNIREKYVCADGKLINDTQTAYVLAYTFGIMTAEEIKPHLLDCLQRNNNHLATGFVGVKYLLPVLCELGEYDLAYEVFTHKDFPSWCYPVVNGATTMWERWDSHVIGVGFSDPKMNSFNHYAFGAVCEWMFSMLLGIRQTQEGAMICPVIDESGKITWAKGSTEYLGEKITVEWKNREDGWTELKVQKPENVTMDLSGYQKVEIIGEETYLIKR